MPSNSDEWMTVLDSNLTLFLIMVSFVFAIIGIFIVAKYFHKQSLLELTTSRKKVNWNRILFSFSIWALFTVVSTLALYFVNPENFVVNFKPIPFLILICYCYSNDSYSNKHRRICFSRLFDARICKFVFK